MLRTDISDVLSDGAIVKTLDGHMYEIDDFDRIDTSMWLPPSDAVVCWERYRMGQHELTTYTLRAEGDKVDATRLR